MPKVSVILAVYNVEPYLRRCLDSLLNQTLKDLEFICIDDCSTDGSLSVLEEYAAKDSRFKVVKSEINGGAAIARNKGLDVATGDYLGFVDPDDALETNFYEKLYKKVQKSNADIVKGAIKTFNLDGSIEVSKLNKSIRKNKYAFINRWTTAIYKRSIVTKNNIRFPDECRKGQDVVFLNRVLLKSKTIELIDDVYYLNYKRQGSLNSSLIPIESIKSAIQAVKLRYIDLNNSNLFNEDVKSYALAYSARMKMLFNTFYQNTSTEAQELCANAIIENYYFCRAIEELDKVFLYPPLIKFIKNKNVKKLIETMLEYDNADKLFGINKQSEKNYNPEKYSNNRKKYTYYKVINEILNILEDENKTALDIGSCGIDVLGQHLFKKRYSVSLSGAINDNKTQGFEMDFFDFEPEEKFDIVTCFQVIEHVERAYDFTQKILNCANTTVISLPYKWYKGHNYTHIQDPVDEKKIYQWTKLKPKHTFYIIDDNNYKCRIICIYGKLSKEQSKKLKQLERKYFDFVNIFDYLFMSSKKPYFLDIKYSNIFERLFSVKNSKKKRKIITLLGLKIKIKTERKHNG